MNIKKTIKKILAQRLKNKIDKHKVSTVHLSVAEARKCIDKVYSPSEYVMNGVVTEKDGYELSLIIPVYNSENYLRECIKSLINQKTSHKYELIFINDGSKDNSAMILDEYTKYENVVVFTQENQGIAKARNKGIELSRGKYIGFIDNDDLVSKDYVDRLLEVALSNNADIVKCRCKEFDSDTRKILHDFGPHQHFSYNGPLGKDIFQFNGFIWGGCYKKSFWGNTQFPDGYWYEDMITRLFLYRKAESFEYIGDPLYFKREHSQNSAKKIWNSKSTKSLDQLFLVLEIMKISDQFNLKHDSILYRLIIDEYGFMLGHRSADLDEKIRKAAFVLASDLVCSFPVEYDDPSDLFATALRKKDYALWKMLSRYNELVY